MRIYDREAVGSYVKLTLRYAGSLWFLIDIHISFCTTLKRLLCNSMYYIWWIRSINTSHFLMCGERQHNFFLTGYDCMGRILRVSTVFWGTPLSLYHTHSNESFVKMSLSYTSSKRTTFLKTDHILWKQNDAKEIKNGSKPGTWVLIWSLPGESFSMNTKMTGFRWLSKICASLCIRRK